MFHVFWYLRIFTDKNVASQKWLELSELFVHFNFGDLLRLGTLQNEILREILLGYSKWKVYNDTDK